MRIKKIKINKFKSIYDTLELDFEDVRGFWKIGGDVGAGKTTIGEAIIFGLFGSVRGKNNEDLISWGQKHSLIETWLTSRGRNIYIRREINKRGQSPIFVTIDGEELLFTNKRDGQAQLETEYYDVSRTTLELLCIISFNNFKSLATLNASDTKRFLDQVLGFYTLTQYADVCKEFRSQKLSEGNALNTLISSTDAQIKKIQELANIELIDGNISAIQSVIQTVTETSNKNIGELNDKLKGLRNELVKENQHLSRIKTLGANKKKEIDFIKKGKCPTCGAPIDDSQLGVKEEERIELLNNYNNIVNTINNINDRIKIVEAEISEARTSYDNAIKSHQALLVQLQEQEKRSKINTAELDKLENQLVELRHNQDTIQSDVAQWDELYNILNEDIRSKILSTFIPSINKNILKYTQELHQPYVIEFDQSFKCSISICGMKDNISFSSLSVGQLKTVDMCIIMGILNVIMDNVSFNIAFFDELFSNMDADLRSTMCQTLKQNMRPNGTLFIISHTTLDPKYFDGEIATHLEYINEIHRKSVYDVQKNLSKY